MKAQSMIEQIIIDLLDPSKHVVVVTVGRREKNYIQERAKEISAQCSCGVSYKHLGHTVRHAGDKKMPTRLLIMDIADARKGTSMILNMANKPNKIYLFGTIVDFHDFGALQRRAQQLDAEFIEI